MSGHRNNSASGSDRSTPNETQRGTPSKTTVLGDFELGRKIGQGGMGTVYEAWQRSLQRTVAVKVLGQQVSSNKTAILRFQREAQAAAKLHHTHIVPVFGAGEVDGVYFYAMELIDGPGLNTIIHQTQHRLAGDTASAALAETLPLSDSDRALRRTSPDPSRSPSSSTDDRENSASRSLYEFDFPEQRFQVVARQLASVADALDYAHRQGVIHRDIKPHNLILGSDGKMRISDFGLARLSEQPGVTVTGEMLGSPLYMSPEQVLGGAAEVDHRTDIYSLGATMYEWLTFSAPYPGETREQVISKILTSEPRPLRAHNPLIPLDLETICLKAIEREREHRYKVAGEFREDLLRFLDKQPIRARRAGATTRIRKLIGRHRLLTVAGSAAAVALVLSLALVTARREAKTQTAAAVQAKEEQRKIEDLLSILPFELGGALRLADAARPMLEGVMGGGTQTDPDTPDDGVRAIDVVSVATPSGITRRVVRDLFRAVEQDGFHRTVAESAGVFGPLLTEAFERWETEPMLAKRVADAFLDKQPDHFGVRQLRAALSSRLGQFVEMLGDAEAMVRLMPEDAASFVWRSLAHISNGNAESGLADVKRAMQLGESVLWSSVVRGLALATAERYVDAIGAFDDALEVDPDFVAALLGRASAYTSLGNVNGAVTDLTQALEFEPENADLLALRGDHHVSLEDFGAAERDYDRAMTIAGRTTSIVLRYLLAHSRQRTLPANGPDS